ncbi:ABC transporter ATP-binding protein [Pseudoalteromonas mariniglutinosa]|uniref:ABC transporter ATP-binding protein n=1 Tax=Pseudoalteromonas mariniglutinosa TaxID=206042 RepID=UPI00384F8973
MGNNICSSTVLTAKSLSKSFDSNVALKSLDLQVSSGEIVCLLGSNGAGKTTTINLFMGFLSPDSGEAIVNGMVVANDPAAARNYLGYVDEIVTLYPSLSGRENLDFFHALSKQPSLSDEECNRILSSLDFPMKALNSRLSTYSKGMRQKLGLAIAVAKNAKAILLDEPLSGLDPKAANDLVAVLKSLAKNGTAILLSTHDIFRAKSVGNRIGIMTGGQLVDIVDPNTLSSQDLEAVYLKHIAEGQ